MQLHALGEGLWSLEQTLRFPGGVTLPLRGLAVRLADGGLALISPPSQLAQGRSGLETLGPVRALVAPNLFHHLGLPAAQRLFPEARVFRRPGLDAKRKEVRFTDLLTEQPPELWADVLAHVEVGGMPRVQEMAFVHGPSRTLLLTDLCFNVHRAPNRLTRFFMRLNGAWERFGPSRIARGAMKDRAAVRAAVDRMLAHDFERIVVAHGDVVETGGRAALERAFASL
ncbi:DUF4336 domain-containing protein [Aggregicoccus sp. 17bor-14]|uniref:DUF4336 domain-containing protein n=1 Tax=Myxococcaceae TaxID=31 RepID=UPI00129C708A|nr:MULTISPECIES: DUF4336 domain-containing protein [Myxococcaceae]MBF5045017.1 DUF4336 domain-containing protein [Simulacricoccus sp. 17bor-14]MRI90760.1 DUF4336 domain-containing protein [Aggregicoccus sp. 17bor-14]